MLRTHCGDDAFHVGELRHFKQIFRISVANSKICKQNVYVQIHTAHIRDQIGMISSTAMQIIVSDVGRLDWSAKPTPVF